MIIGHINDPSIEFLRTILNLEINFMDQYLVSAEENMKAGKKQSDKYLSQYIEDELLAHPDNSDYKKELLATFKEDSFSYQETFASILQRSTFIANYSMFEYYLKRICDFAKKRVRSNLSFSDIKGNGYIDQNKRYLEKVIGLNLSYLNTIWEDINKYRIVRNYIVHEHSNISVNPELNTTDQKHYTLVSSMPSIEINPVDGEIKIKDFAFVWNFSHCMEQYLKGILIELVKVKEVRI